MPEKVSRMFRVNFDLYTPRAHFIILPVEEFKESIKQYPELKKDTKLELLKSAKSIVSEYKLQNSAILSLHFGSWLSTKNKFHAHICVDVDDYLKIFSERRKEAIVFPPENKRNKWSNGKDTEDYEKNVRKYPPHTYFLEEVQAIHTIKGDRSKPTESGASNITCPPSPYLLHPSEPRVGYVVENSETPKDNESDLKALKEMCLVLDEKPHGKSILVNLP